MTSRESAIVLAKALDLSLIHIFKSHIHIYFNIFPQRYGKIK